MKTIILDPGHGMSNRRRGVYDTGAVMAGLRESELAMRWVNTLRAFLINRGYRVVRTRINETQHCPVWSRDDIAKSYGGDMMLSFHCNAAANAASGAEVFYRGRDNRLFANKLSAAVATNLGLKDRGAKTEAQSQHSSLSVLDFNDCWLIELGFITNDIDRKKMSDEVLIRETCEAIADEIDAYFVQ